MQHPAVKQMLKYSFFGTRENVKVGIRAFLETTQVDELIVVTNIYNGADRIKSYQSFAEIMDEINSEAESN